MKLAWAFPARPGAKPAPAPAAKPAPAPAKPAQKAPAPVKPAVKPAAAPSRTVETGKTAPRQGGTSPKPAKTPPKPTKDVMTAGPQDKDYSLIGYGNPPRHPQTGQELAPYGPGRAPELFHKNGEVTGRPLWRYEGSEHWQSDPTAAMHAWMAVFKSYFPDEAVMLGTEYRKLMEAEARAKAADEEALLD